MAAEPIKLVIRLVAPGQDAGCQPDPIAEGTRRGDQHVQHPVVGTRAGDQLNVGQQETDIADHDDMCPALEGWLIIYCDGGVHGRVVGILCRGHEVRG